ncbi:MAG: hypothetical protein JW818_00280 [Pirellulales bacterium]|nr:hypothetical protein [Pirellulales bacterium]
MSFSQWWDDQRDPMEAGTVQLGCSHVICRNPFLVWARFLFVVIGLPVLWYFVAPHVPLPTWQAWTLVVGVTFIYVALSYLINPKPDEAGLMVDHYTNVGSDIWNRGLIYFALILGPGRFVAEAGLDMLILFQTRRAERALAEAEADEDWEPA